MLTFDLNQCEKVPTVVDFQMLCGHEESSFEIDICRLFEAFPWGFTSWYGEAPVLY